MPRQGELPARSRRIISQEQSVCFPPFLSLPPSPPPPSSLSLFISRFFIPFVDESLSGSFHPPTLHCTSRYNYNTVHCLIIILHLPSSIQSFYSILTLKYNFIIPIHTRICTYIIYNEGKFSSRIIDIPRKIRRLCKILSRKLEIEKNLLRQKRKKRFAFPAHVSLEK